MKLSEIHIRDPYVLPYGGKYYLYGTTGATCWGAADCFYGYMSGDLDDWEGPFEIFRRPEGFWADRHYWAPEVHFYKGSFYMFASFKAEGVCRGTQILKSSSPLGPFELHSDGPVTPPDWECLDGTLYVDGSGTPFIVFCHEWVQIRDGTICVRRLSDGLDAPAGEPLTLFHGSDPSWADKDAEHYVTDGPFLYRRGNGELLMLWSSSTRDYVQAVSRSASGEIEGPWEHDSELIFEKDGGHGMLFRAFDGRLMMALHRPNNTPRERAVFFEMGAEGGE